MARIIGGLAASHTPTIGFAFDKGAKMAEDLDYVPMPANVIDLIKKTWSADVKSM